MAAVENAITLRLEKLANQWDDFCAQPAPLLRWLFLPDEQSLFQTFVEIESGEGAQAEDAWVALHTRFENEYTHGYTLARELARFMDTAELEEGEKRWVCPEAQREENDCTYLVRCCRSFYEFHQDGFDHFGVILSPSGCANVKNYQRWMLRLVQEPVIAEVRFIAPDNARQPSYDALALQATPQKVVSIYAHLDIPGALAELSAPPDNPEPGDLFRQHFVATQSAVGKSDMVAAEQSADQGFAIAKEQNWPQLEAPLYMLLAAGFIGLKQSDAALEKYKLAQTSADKATEQNDPAGPKLKMHALLGECSVHVQERDYETAAPLYAQAALIASEQKDEPMALECHRMAAFCFSKESQWENAWMHGHKSLEIAEALGPEKVVNTAFPYAAKDLLRASKKNGPDDERETLPPRIEALLGPDWEEKMKESQAS